MDEPKREAPSCPCCGGKMTFRSLVAGYCVGGCQEDDCGAEIRFYDMQHKKSAFAIYINDPAEFRRRILRRPGVRE